MMSQRLEVVRLLVHADSDVSLQDAHGDNVLHWCARESHTLLLRFFLKETDAGVAAIFAENYKREKVPRSVSIGVVEGVKAYRLTRVAFSVTLCHSY